MSLAPSLAFSRGPERELRDHRPTTRLPRLILALTLTLAAGALHAVELTPGLSYLRPGMELSPHTGSTIVDLRAATEDTDAAALLAALPASPAHANRIVLVLVSPETPPALRRLVSTLPRSLTIGRVEPDFKTDIAVSTPPDADRRATAALAAGAEPGKLLAENIDKPRYDESSLVREHAGESPVAAPSATPSTDVVTSSAAPIPAPAEPAVFDAVLQRAVHVYRGLVVLKKA